MRLSIADQGHHQYQVFLNGEKMERVVSADEARGEAWVAGCYSYLEVLMGLVHVTRCFKGQVEIRRVA